MSVPPAVLLAIAAAACCARAELFRDESARVLEHSGQNYIVDHKSNKVSDSPGLGCLYEGRWYVSGAAVAARDACLRCACAGGALSCSRRACAPLPDPPPPRCHVRHRRGVCCPELHCPDGVTSMEQTAAARLELDDSSGRAATLSRGRVCVEGGAVFAAGSAMAARAACEACFCLGGARRCVRPSCPPPPPRCASRPAPGACCPQRYYCDPPAPGNSSQALHQPPHKYDCEVDGTWVQEGERVQRAEKNCTRCFCLHARVHCEPLACAPPLLGCRPLLRPGDCCPHQYHCDRDEPPTHFPLISDNALTPVKYDDRALHTKAARYDSTTISAFISSHKPTMRSEPIATHTSEPVALGYTSERIADNASQTVATAKVKRKTSDSPPTSTQQPQKPTLNPTVAKPASTLAPKTTTKPTASSSTLQTTTTTKPTASTEHEPENATTEQPEGSVKVIINGTINCTAELTSSSSATNSSANETQLSPGEAQARVPISAVEAAGDVITSGDFDDRDSFIVNVSSSLSHSKPPADDKVVPPVSADAPNASTNEKEDYDYDYIEPNLPPSLPNLKIIPFVAADAVVDEETPKEPYPLLEREDKFPVYYPTIESKATPVATRREDLPTQYPIYVDKDENGQYPSVAQEELNSSELPRPNSGGVNSLAAVLREFTVAAALATRGSDAKVTKPPSKSTTFKVETPAVNLFSPPAETEGGFVPKGPGIIDEYYAVYPSTPPGPPVPHLTTSMQIDAAKPMECVTSDGRRVAEGESLAVACSVCSCGWGELHCAPRPCPAPPGCRRRPASISSADLCCGELVCDNDNKTTAAPMPTRGFGIPLNESKVPPVVSEVPTVVTELPDVVSEIPALVSEVPPVVLTPISSDMIPFDPPHDRAEPPTTSPVLATVTTKASTERAAIKGVNKTFSVSTQTPPTVANISMTSERVTDRANFNTTSKPTASDKLSTMLRITTVEPETTTVVLEPNETSSNSQEYEDDEEDEGFSFGSVLKLLLSESFDSTTAAPKRKLSTSSSQLPPTSPVTTVRTTPLTTTTTPAPRPPTPVWRLPPKPTVAPFVPMPQHPYSPPKKSFIPNTVNRIDHLVLGEATAIKKSTPRPPTTSFRPVTTSFRLVTTSFRPVTTSFRPLTTFKHYTRKPSTTTTPTSRINVASKNEVSDQYTSVTHEVVRPSNSGVVPAPAQGLGGLLKLAGCNIYGRMYRVGRIIAELSTPCQECRCTELGVQCRPLAC